MKVFSSPPRLGGVVLPKAEAGWWKLNMRRQKVKKIFYEMIRAFLLPFRAREKNKKALDRVEM